MFSFQRLTVPILTIYGVFTGDQERLHTVVTRRFDFFLQGILLVSMPCYGVLAEVALTAGVSPTPFLNCLASASWEIQPI